MRKERRSVGPDILSAHRRRMLVLDCDSKITCIDIAAAGWSSAEFTPLRPSDVRPVFGPDGGIHAAIDGPIECVAQDGAFAGGGAKHRSQKSTLARQFFYRM